MKLVSWIRGAAAAAVVLACASLAQAQDFGVSPSEGAIGQEVTLTSKDAEFGARRGRITLSQSAEKRRRVPSAKIVSWSADEIVFTVHKATEGLTDITVRPRGRGAPVLTNNENFRVLGPQLSGRNGDRFEKGATLVLNGDNFGTVRGRVALSQQTEAKRGSRKPRVLSWANNTVEVRLPTAGPDGFYDITLTNFAGESTSMSPIELVTPPRPIRGKDRIVGVVGGPFSAVKGAGADQAHWTQSALDSLILFGNDVRVGIGGSTLRSFQIILDPRANVDDIVVPRTFTGSGVVSMTYSRSVSGRRGTTLTNYTLDEEREYSVRIDNIVDGRMSGSFSATLVKTGDQPGPGPSVLRVRGTFVLNTLVPN